MENELGGQSQLRLTAPGLALGLGSHGWYVGYVLMILPQVHLRKPCYDFYFL